MMYAVSVGHSAAAASAWFEGATEPNENIARVSVATSNALDQARLLSLTSATNRCGRCHNLIEIKIPPAKMAI
jgi:hypothetical protein